MACVGIAGRTVAPVGVQLAPAGSGNQAGHHADDADDDCRQDSRPEERVDGEVHRREAAQPSRQVQHRCVDDNREQSKGQDRHGKGKDLDQWPYERVDHSEDQANEKVCQDDPCGVGAFCDPGVCGGFFSGRRGDLQSLQQPAGDPEGKAVDQYANDE